MTRNSEILSEIVAEVRRLRSKGARASEVARALTSLGLISAELKDHIDAAFGIDMINPLYLTCDQATGEFIAADFDKRVEPAIAAAGDAWKRARPYPDLLRRRDRHAFRKLARETGNVFIVQAGVPEAAQYVGRAGFKPFPLHLLDVTRHEAPHVGLVAGDPESPVLRETLAALRPELTYDGYLGRLAAEGFSVGEQAEGFVIQDRDGTLFYPGYRLLGVYREGSGQSAWSSTDGARMRWMLNRRMGEDLVQFGPHDDWDGRRSLKPGNPLRGPFTPALFFTPDGNVTVEFDAESMKGTYHFLMIDWSALYPGEAAPPPGEVAT